ncbi:MAG: energy transducer TonB [Hyphomicrobiales bacterium]|nr:energy transducer TonB [Hyphomicrobiales bacterium]
MPIYRTKRQSSLTWRILRTSGEFLLVLFSPLLEGIKTFSRYFSRRYPGGYYSLMMHAVLLLLLAFNMSWCKPRPKEENIITIDLVSLPPETEKPKEEKPEAPKPLIRPTPPPPPPPEPEPIKEVLPEPKPAPKPEKPKPKPEPPKPKPPKPKPEKPKPPAPLLKTLEKPKEEAKPLAKPAKDAKPAKPNDAPPAPPTLTPQQLSALQRLIQSQMLNCWNIPAGARGVENMEVPVHVWLNADGSVRDVELQDASRYNNPAEPYYRSLADSALRAIRFCRLQLPPELYDGPNGWKEIEFTFDPGLMVY